MYAPVVMEENSVSFYNEQQNNNDTVFNTRNLNSRHASAVFITNDKDYEKPDRGQYIFSTMGNNLTAMFSNNMVVPIRSKPTLNGHHMYSRIMEHADNVDDGVYIVDYYTICNDGTTSVENVLNYYINSVNIEYNRHTVDNIINKVTTRHGNQFPTEVKIRLITFISAKDINEHMNLYVDKSDILIIKGNVTNNIVHPTSRTYKENGAKKINAHNAIEIEIVDNINQEPYYVRLGNNMEKFIPTKDINRPNGARLNVYKNGVITTAKKSKLEDLDKTLGFYKNKDAAESNGDVSKLADLEKLNVEKQKMKLELTKIEHEKVKLVEDRDFYRAKYEHELAMMEQKFKVGQLDIIRKKEEMSLLYAKSEIDIVMSTHKFDIDTKISVNKFNLDQAKSFADLAIKTGITLMKNI